MTNKNDIDRLAKEQKNAYLRKWKSKNRDKVKEYNARYWKKRAEKMLKEKGVNKNDDTRTN